MAEKLLASRGGFGSIDLVSFTHEKRSVLVSVEGRQLLLELASLHDVAV